MLTYTRYDIDLEQAALEELGLKYTPKQVAGLRKMGNAKNIPELDKIGVAAAKAQVREEHFPPDLDRVRSRSNERVQH